MNVGNIIRGMKEKVKESTDFEAKRKQAVMNKAEKLKSMREERIKLEGRAKINKLYSEEKNKISQLKKDRFKQSTFGKAVSELKEYKKKKDKQKKPSAFGLSNDENNFVKKNSKKSKKYSPMRKMTDEEKRKEKYINSLMKGGSGFV